MIFKKAFDSNLQQGVFLKMQNAGIMRLFYNIVKNMYTDNILRMKIGHGMTDAIHSEIGLFKP